MKIVVHEAGGRQGSGAVSAETLEFVRKVRERMGKVVVGQDIVVERLLIALFTGGHLLCKGCRGWPRRCSSRRCRKTIDLHFARIQFTVDLLPSDILGSEILDQRTNDFRIHKGPIFTNLLLADEINRAAPKVQSALLEAMQERRVTIGNETFRLPAPFLVIATQNPIEQSGTFELPEAQLDRFMFCHRLDYPTAEEEKEILRRNAALGVRREDRGAVARTEFDVLTEGRSPPPRSSCGPWRPCTKFMSARPSPITWSRSSSRTRNHPHIELGSSPRAGIALVKGARARALIHGRNYVIPEDLFALAEDVILHRMRLTYEALAEGRDRPRRAPGDPRALWAAPTA